MVRDQVFSGWAHIARCKDVPGAWLASCPAFGVMAQGDSLESAISLIKEAVSLFVVDELDEGRSPHAQASSEPEDWAPLHRLFGRHRAIPADQLAANASRADEFAVWFTLVFRSAAGRGFAADPSINLPQTALAPAT